MLRIEPDFYKDFKCIASACRHSCCLGWEIDIDDEALSRFMAVEGEFGDYIRANIDHEPQAHFRLSTDERCPFLQKDGLCRMILEIGEDKLCHICSEHPRFYNELPGRMEAGLGLCCEEAARLLLDGRGHLTFSASGEDEGEEDELISLRDEIYALLREDGLSLSERMAKVMGLWGMELMPFDAAALSRFYMGLERLEEDWTKKLQALESFKAGLEPELSRMRYVRLCEYFIYRHFAVASDAYEAALRAQFAFLSTRVICAMDMLSDDIEATRLYSAEIEYSDENLGLVLDYIDENT